MTPAPAFTLGGVAPATRVPHLTKAPASQDRPKRRLDPRLYQIAILSALLVYGITGLGFDVSLATVGLTLLGTLGTQWVCTRLWNLPAFDPRSPLISGLSLCLLLRANEWWWVLAAAAVTIGSKFVLRWNGKHVFNPTNLGLVAMMAATGQVWVSPGQWGSFAFFAFLLACLGGLVVNRAARSDVTYAFLGAYLAIVFGRSLWLGQPVSIPLHQLQNGAFLLFTFFMISDPKTTPDSRAGRIVFACLVAAGATFIQFALYGTNGLLWSLAGFAFVVPLIDRLLPGKRYRWAGAAGTARNPATRPASLRVPRDATPPRAQTLPAWERSAS